MSGSLTRTAAQLLLERKLVMEKPLLTYAQAAALLGLKLPTLYTLVSRRSVPRVRLSGRIVRFDPAVLEAWRNSRAVPVDERPSRRACSTAGR